MARRRGQREWGCLISTVGMLRWLLTRFGNVRKGNGPDESLSRGLGADGRCALLPPGWHPVRGGWLGSRNLEEPPGLKLGESCVALPRKKKAGRARLLCPEYVGGYRVYEVGRSDGKLKNHRRRKATTGPVVLVWPRNDAETPVYQKPPQ